MVHFVVVDGHEDRPVLPEQCAEQLQARHQHAAPLVVPGQVIAVHHPAQPVPHEGRIHVVVVRPALVARVVGRIDVDALYLSVIGRQQRLQRGQVIAVDDQVVVEARLLAQPVLARRQQLVEGYGQVMVLYEYLPLEVEPWQGALLWRVQSVSSAPPASIGRMFTPQN